MTWKYFTLDEFKCRGVNCCGGTNKIDLRFVDKLDDLRSLAGFALIVSSGYRCAKHNTEVSDTGPNGPHTTGHAVDFAIARAQAYSVLKIAIAIGFSGIGVSQKGASRFLHLDDLPDAQGQPRPTLWSY